MIALIPSKTKHLWPRHSPGSNYPPLKGENNCAPKIHAMQRKKLSVWRGPRDRTKKRDKNVRLIRSQDKEGK